MSRSIHDIFLFLLKQMYVAKVLSDKTTKKTLVLFIIQSKIKALFESFSRI